MWNKSKMVLMDFYLNVIRLQALLKKLIMFFSLPEKAIAEMRKNAYKKVIFERDFFKNFEKTLDGLWTKRA